MNAGTVLRRVATRSNARRLQVLQRTASVLAPRSCVSVSHRVSQRRPLSRSRSSSSSSSSGGSSENNNVGDAEHTCSLAEFHREAERVLEALAEASESALEADPAQAAFDYDITFEDGVLTLALGGARGTYVLNKQVPNRQIWWSSPISGPMRFHYRAANDEWRNVRDESRTTLVAQFVDEFQQRTQLDIADAVSRELSEH